MPQSGYPDINELEDLLTSAGILAASAGAENKLFTEAYLDAAIEEWEHTTGWHPFLKDSQDVMRLFDPPGAPNRHAATFGAFAWRGGGRILELDGGLLTVTSLVVGYSSQTAGTALTANQQYWLLPRNAAAIAHPYQRVEFASPQWGQSGSIAITGKWGYCAEDAIPGSVRLAILCYAAFLAIAEHAGMQSGGMQSIKLADGAGYQYPAEGQFAQQAKQWAAYWRQTSLQHRRVSIGA